MHQDVVSFRNHLEELGRSPNTVRQYTWHVQCMLDYLDKDADEVTRLDLSSYRHHLAVEKGYSKNSLYLATKAIQAFFSYLILDTAVDLTAPKRRR